MFFTRRLFYTQAKRMAMRRDIQNQYACERYQWKIASFGDRCIITYLYLFPIIFLPMSYYIFDECKKSKKHYHCTLCCVPPAVLAGFGLACVWPILLWWRYCLKGACDDSACDCHKKIEQC